eukprot:1149573-Pyramimonas_sp.AAC.1
MGPTVRPTAPRRRCGQTAGHSQRETGPFERAAWGWLPSSLALFCQALLTLAKHCQDVIRLGTPC